MRKLLWLLLLTSAFAQTTSTITGAIKDLSQVVVATGKVTFTLVPGGDATISGFARFSNQIVTCTINQAAVATSQAVRAANSVTISSLTSHTFIVNDVITVSGMTDSTFNGTFTVTSKTASSITYSQTAGNATSGGGVVSALRGGAPAGTTAGSCLVTQNTALNPPGSSYLAKLYPSNVLTSQFTFAAYNSAIDITTIVPTPSQLPTYFVVDTVNNQSIAGNKTFTGSTVFSGTLTASAGITSNFFASASVNTAATGVLRFASADQFCFRNNANGADVCIAKTAGASGGVPADTADFSAFGAVKSLAFITNSANPAQSTVVRLAASDCAAWRNAGNTADLSLCKDAQDRLTYNSKRFSDVIYSTAGAGVTIANSAAEASAYTTDSTRILANTITATGQALKFRYVAKYSTTATPTLQTRFRLDSCCTGTVFADSTGLTTANNASNLGVEVNVTCIFTAVGAGGSASCAGTVGLGGLNVFQLSPVTLAYDTTVNHDGVPTEQWGAANAANTVTGQSLTIERPN